MGNSVEIMSSTYADCRFQLSTLSFYRKKNILLVVGTEFSIINLFCTQDDKNELPTAITVAGRGEKQRRQQGRTGAAWWTAHVKKRE